MQFFFKEECIYGVMLNVDCRLNTQITQLVLYTLLFKTCQGRNDLKQKILFSLVSNKTIVKCKTKTNDRERILITLFGLTKFGILLSYKNDNYRSNA